MFDLPYNRNKCMSFDKLYKMTMMRNKMALKFYVNYKDKDKYKLKCFNCHTKYTLEVF